MIRALLATFAGVLIGAGIVIGVLAIEQTGCTYATGPRTPEGWALVHEWKGNPPWCQDK